jgi:hypothetical protein
MRSWNAPDSLRPVLGGEVVSDAQLREDFFSNNFLTVSGVIDDAAMYPGDDRVVVLCDLLDESGVTFVTFSGAHGKDSIEVGGAWAAHFNRRVLSLLLDCSWPSLERVIAALRSDECYESAVLVVAHGGVQLRCVRQAGEVPA